MINYQDRTRFLWDAWKRYWVNIQWDWLKILQYCWLFTICFLYLWLFKSIIELDKKMELRHLEYIEDENKKLRVMNPWDVGTWHRISEAWYIPLYDKIDNYFDLVIGRSLNIPNIVEIKRNLYPYSFYNKNKLIFKILMNIYHQLVRGEDLSREYRLSYEEQYRLECEVIGKHPIDNLILQDRDSNNYWVYEFSFDFTRDTNIKSARVLFNTIRVTMNHLAWFRYRFDMLNRSSKDRIQMKSIVRYKWLEYSQHTMQWNWQGLQNEIMRDKAPRERGINDMLLTLGMIWEELILHEPDKILEEFYLERTCRSGKLTYRKGPIENIFEGTCSAIGSVYSIGKSCLDYCLTSYEDMNSSYHHALSYEVNGDNDIES